MSRLYIEGAIAAVLFITGIVTGWHFGALHWKGEYQVLVASQDAASAKAANDAALRIQTQRATYDAQLQAITDSYHREIAASDVTADSLNEQLRIAAGRLSRCSVQQGRSAAIGTHGSDADAKKGTDIAEAIASFEQAVGDLADTGLKESKRMTALQAERASIK